MRYLILLLVLASPMLWAQQTVQPSVFQALTSAQQAQQQGNYGQARDTLQQALNQVRAGSLEQALIEQRLGYLAIARDRHEEAIDWLSKGLAHDRLEAEAASQDRRNLAQLLAVAGRYREAVALLEAEQARGSLPRDSQRLLVQAYSQLRQFDKAIPLAERVVREEPGIDAAWYQLLVGMNYRLQRYSQAERWLKQMLRREPANAEFWRQLAAMQSLDNRPRAAASSLRLAYEAGVRFSASDLDSLVGLQTQAGAPWQAARLLEEMFERGLLPANAERRERLAQLWQLARDRQRAESAWRSLAEHSGRASHWLRVAAVQMEREDWSGLLASLARAEADASAEQRRQIRLWQGYARQALGEPEAARRALLEVSDGRQAEEARRLLEWIDNPS